MKKKNRIARRSFLKSCAALSCGFTGALFAASAAEEAERGAAEGRNAIGPRKGFSPQVGTLVSMLNWMRGAVLEPVQGLSMKQLDISTMKRRTRSARCSYIRRRRNGIARFTPSKVKGDDWDEETKKRWGIPGGLGGGPFRWL